MNKIRLLKFFWLLSGIIGLVILIYSYANIVGNEISIPNSIIEISISKNVYFYSVVAAIIAINGPIYFLSHLLKSKKELNSNFFNKIELWLFGMALIINFFIICTVIFLSLLNNSFINYLNSIGYLIIASLTALVIWLLRLPLLLKKN